MAIIWRSNITVEPVSLASVAGRSRVVGVVLRCKIISVFVVEVYLWIGEGLSPRNIDLLQSVAEMGVSSGCPVIELGDM